jgi:hypothetical protein
MLNPNPLNFWDISYLRAVDWRKNRGKNLYNVSFSLCFSIQNSCILLFSLGYILYFCIFWVYPTISERWEDIGGIALFFQLLFPRKRVTFFTEAIIKKNRGYYPLASLRRKEKRGFFNNPQIFPFKNSSHLLEKYPECVWCPRFLK